MIKTLYGVLAEELGGLESWWAADTPFERIAGAILVQQTRWENVEKVIREIKCMGLMSPESMDALTQEELELLVRPAGFYRNKARSLKEIARYFTANPGALELPMEKLREELLGLRGIGNETADVLILYVAGRPSFVVDAYTIKMLKCLGIEGNYRQLQELFHRSLPRDTAMFQHYHALIVEHGKRYCNKKDCESCVVKKVQENKSICGSRRKSPVRL